MAYKIKPTANAASVTVGLALGLGISWGITLLSAVITACLIASEAVGEGSVPAVAVATMMAASFAGAMASGARIGQRRLVICLVSGVLYYVSLMGCNALFYQGHYQGVLAALLSILGCCMLAGLLGLRRKSGKYKGLRGVYKG